MTIHRRDALRLAGGALGLAVASPAFAETALERVRRTGTVTVGLANEKPYGYVETDGRVTGAIVDVLREAMAPLGVTKLEASIGAFSTLLPGVLARRFDLIGAGMYINPRRCEQVAFTNPIARAGGAFAAKAGNPKKLTSLKSVAADRTARIGTQTGTNQVEEIRRAGIAPEQLVLFSKDTEAVAGLQAGRVDVIYFPGLSINTLLATTGDRGLERVDGFEQIAGPDGQPVFNYHSLGFHKDDADFVEAVNARIADMLKSGRLYAVMGPYGFSADEMPTPEATAERLCKAVA